MSNHKTDIIISNTTFTLVALITIGFVIVDTVSGTKVEDSFILSMSADSLVFIIPALFLINAIYALKPTCAGWWSLLKGAISFIYLAVFTTGMVRILPVHVGHKIADLLILMLWMITSVMLIFPIVGIIRKKKAKKTWT